jgi:hypothetical protein
MFIHQPLQHFKTIIYVLIYAILFIVMSAVDVADFLQKRYDLDQLQKTTDEAVAKFLQAAGRLAGTRFERESWRSVIVAGGDGFPLTLASGVTVNPQEWLSLAELGQLMASWHQAVQAAVVAWRKLTRQEQLQLPGREPPDF